MATTVLSNLDFGNVAKITNLANGTDVGDAVNRGQLDSAIEGLKNKPSARVATNANINLAAPGTAINGITMAANDRVLVKDQTTASQNGIYIYNSSSTPMTRAIDANTIDELANAVVQVREGDSATITFRQTTVSGTLDTTNIVWITFGGTVPTASESTAGIAEIATQAETDTGTDDTRFVTPAKMANWSGRKRKLAQLIGDGTATSYTVTHNFNTRDVEVQVYRNSGNYDKVIVDIEFSTANAVIVKFAAAPASNAFRVVVLA